MKFQDVVLDYRCDSKTNNSIHRHFTDMTASHEFLSEHRNYVEAHRLGFGDRAFHSMWFLLLQDLFERKSGVPKFLEVGVYKGQVISLWSLIAKQLKRECEISCISPLSGNVMPKNRLMFCWHFFTEKKFRRNLRSGNFYENENYLNAITSLFERFGSNFETVKLYKGLSTDFNILSELGQSKFDLVYIDGDHTRKVVEMDIKNYAPKVRPGGFLVMDDAACNIPGGEGNEYWKGHKSVSDACEIIPKFDFVNVLNVGHNRIFQKV